MAESKNADEVERSGVEKAGIVKAALRDVDLVQETTGAMRVSDKRFVDITRSEVQRLASMVLNAKPKEVAVDKLSIHITQFTFQMRIAVDRLEELSLGVGSNLPGVRNEIEIVLKQLAEAEVEGVARELASQASAAFKKGIKGIEANREETGQIRTDIFVSTQNNQDVAEQMYRAYYQADSSPASLHCCFKDSSKKVKENVQAEKSRSNGSDAQNADANRTTQNQFGLKVEHLLDIRLKEIQKLKE